MNKMNGKSVKAIATILPIAVLASMSFSMAPMAHAYGSQDQWQVAFSLSGHGGTFGIWGWCALGGRDGSSAPGTTGTTANCEHTVYNREATPPNFNTVHLSIDASSWTIATGSASFHDPTIPTFFLTGGKVVAQGPGAATLGIPTGIPLPLSGGCDFSNIPVSLVGSLCDLGLPAVPGHFDFQSSGPNGVTVNIQVNQLP